MPPYATCSKPGSDQKSANVEEYHLLFERNPQPMWVLDPQTLRFLDVNEAAIRHYGYARGEFLTMTVRDIRPPEKVPRVLKHAGKSPTGLDSAEVRRHLKKDGTLITVEVFQQSITWAGRPSRLVLAQDVTERELREELLRQSEEKFSKAFRSSPDAIIIITLDEGQYIDVNESFLRMTAYTRREIVGHTAAEVGFWLDPADRARLVAGLRERRELKDIEISFRTKRGEVRPALISAHTIELGGKTCALEIMQDVAQRRLLEAQLLQVQKMEAIGRLAGGVAHDFNNVLVAVLGYSELLTRRLASDPRSQDMAAKITAAAVQARDLTSQLLAFGRKQALQPKVIDLSSLLLHIASLLQRIIGENIQLAAECDPALSNIEADPAQLEQVILNLAVNARDAMPDGGSLIIKAVNLQAHESSFLEHRGIGSGPCVKLSVIDTGSGMDSTTLAHIFEPFFTTKEPDKGSGLGLSMVYGIVKQSGGHIEVMSELGRGTRFDIYFPSTQKQVEEWGIAGAQPGPLYPVGSETILLAEDEGSVRQLIREVLQESGYVVLSANTGTESLHLAREYDGAIHLLITDMVIPGFGGAELARRLRRLKPKTKVLYITGYADSEIQSQAGALSHSSMLLKPFKPEQFLQKVREVLDA